MTDIQAGFSAIDSFDPDDDGRIVNLRPGWCFDAEQGLHCFGISDGESINDYFGRIFRCNCAECVEESRK